MNKLNPHNNLINKHTNKYTLYKKTSQKTKIKYINFTSLYPFINKITQYPIKHPKIITHKFNNITTYFKLTKIKILPPQHLFHPILNYHSKNKLTFPLYQTYIKLQQQNSYTYSNTKKTLTKTYYTPKLLKTIKKKYQILKIYKIYH